MTNTGMARVLMGLLLVAVGCGSSDDDAAPGAAAGSAGQAGAAGASGGGAAGSAGTAGASAGSGGSGGKGDKGITLSGTVVEAATSPEKPLDGASVCVVGRADIPCALTDATGAYVLEGAPRGVESGIVVSKSGYLSVARLGRNASVAMKLGATSLASHETAKGLATAAGFPYPTAGTALVYVAASTPGTNGYEGLAGVTTTLTVPFAGGPVYVQEGGAPDPTATATTTDGGAYFSGVSPGPFEAAFTAPGKLCADAVGGWASTTSGHLAGVALADTLTTLSISCE